MDNLNIPKIFYGVPDFLFDVTEIATSNFLIDNKLVIPVGDHQRAQLFGDPKYGISKSIFINGDEYTHDKEVLIENFIPSKPAKELINELNKSTNNNRIRKKEIGQPVETFKPKINDYSLLLLKQNSYHYNDHYDNVHPDEVWYMKSKVLS